LGAGVDALNPTHRGRECRHKLPGTIVLEARGISGKRKNKEKEEMITKEEIDPW
jgi:hypothetical protein